MKQPILRVAPEVREINEVIEFLNNENVIEIIENPCQPEQDRHWVTVAGRQYAGALRDH
jgi:hypothetical protein